LGVEGVVVFLVLGGSGNLGSALIKFFNSNGTQCLSPSSSELNVLNRQSVSNYFIQNGPKIKAIINCIAWTDVDGCEKNPEKAFEVNSIAPAHMANVAQYIGVPFIQISTDYVFDGKGSSAYSEDHPTNPIQVYGQSKDHGDRAVLMRGGCIARVQWILGESKKNFVTWVIDALRSKTPINLSTLQRGGPTSCVWLASRINDLIHQTSLTGIYHLVHDDYVNRYDCGLFIADYLGLSHEGVLNPVDHVNFGVAKRPENTMLSNKHTKSLMRALGSEWAWREDLSEYLRGKRV
jgi:dTDP-4-dehydrorhamnose reductase